MSFHYLIDGYNFLFNSEYEEESFKEVREKIISDLFEQIQLLDFTVTIIFDAHFQADDFKKHHRNNLELVYTAKDQTADDYIIEYLAQVQDPHQFVLVTSDNHLKGRARFLSIKVMDIKAFQSFLVKAPEKANKKSHQEESRIQIQGFDHYLKTFTNRFKKSASSEKEDQSFAKKKKKKP